MDREELKVEMLRCYKKDLKDVKNITHTYGWFKHIKREV